MRFAPATQPGSLAEERLVGVEPRDGEFATVVGIRFCPNYSGFVCLFVFVFCFVLMRICIFFWIYGFDFLEVSMLIVLEFFVLRLILSGLVN